MFSLFTINKQVSGIDSSSLSGINMGQGVKECEEVLYLDKFSKARLIHEVMPFRDSYSN